MRTMSTSCRPSDLARPAWAMHMTASPTQDMSPLARTRRHLVTRDRPSRLRPPQGALAAVGAGQARAYSKSFGADEQQISRHMPSLGVLVLGSRT